MLFVSLPWFTQQHRHTHQQRRLAKDERAWWKNLEAMYSSPLYLGRSVSAPRAWAVAASLQRLPFAAAASPATAAARLIASPRHATTASTTASLLSDEFASPSPVATTTSNALSGSPAAGQHHQQPQQQHQRRTFQPFSEKEEQDLVAVMSSRPRHVLRHVRQSIWRGRKRELHFRATVTHLMIVLQDFLRKQQIEPANAAVILEGTMEECVRLSQHDLAHLLFRAFLRFRKYGCQISLDALRLLFDSYRGTDNADMMLQLAKEMSADADLRAFCIAAYLYAGRVDEAERLRAAVPAGQVEAKDVIAMVHGYHKLRMPDKVLELVRGVAATHAPGGGGSDAASASASSTAADAAGDAASASSPSSTAAAAASSRAPTYSSEELGEIVAAALRAFFESDSDAPFNECFDIGRRLEVAFPASAFATVLRMKLRRAETMADVTQVESDLRAIGYVPDLTGNSVIVAAYARMIHFGDVGSEEVMLAKVDTLLTSVEARMKQQDPDVDVSSAHLRAVLRGYGAAGRPELMKKAWEAMQYKGLSNDTRVYNELLKWFCLMGNVKDVLKTKADMVRDEVQADATTFTWVMRALGKFYPRQAERFYAEMRALRIRPDPALYSTLIGIFGDLGNLARVDELRSEISSRENAGTLPVTPATYAVLLRVYAADMDVVEAIWRDCVAKGIADHDHIVTTLLHAYAGAAEREAAAAAAAANHGSHHGAKDASSPPSSAPGGGAAAATTPDAAAATAEAGPSATAAARRLQSFLQTLPHWSTSVYNVLLHMYGKRGDLGKINELLDKMKRDGTKLNDVTFGTLVSVYGRAKLTDRVADVMELIKQQEGQVSASFYSILASTYSKLGDADGIDEAWEDLMASRLFPDTETYNAFLTLYSKHHNVRRMQVVLDSMMRLVPPNPITSTTVVDMLGKAGRIAEMEELVGDMKKLPETAPTSVTYHQLMNAYAKAGDVVKMEKTRDDFLSAGFHENAVTLNILADGYGRSRRFEQVAEVTQRRRALGIAMDDLGYCVLISNYGRARLTAEVMRLAREVSALLAEERGLDAAGAGGGPAEANAPAAGAGATAGAAVASLESALSSSPPSVRLARSSSSSASSSSASPPGAVVTRKVVWSLIDALCRCNETAHMSEWIATLGELGGGGGLSAGEKNQLISYYARCGMLDHVDATAAALEAAGEDVSFSALNAIAKSYARQGRFDRCVETLHRLRDRGMVPDAATALTLSQLFIRAGLHEQAQQIVQWRRYHAKAGQPETETEDVIV